MPLARFGATFAPKVVPQGRQIKGENQAIPAIVMLCDSGKSIKRLQDLNLSAHFWTFREHIDLEKWSEEHATLVRTIKEHAHSDTQVVVLNEILPLESDPELSKAFMNSPNISFMRDPVCSLPWEPGKFFHCSHQPHSRIYEPDLVAQAVKQFSFTPLFPKLERSRYQLYQVDGGDLIPFVYDGVRCLLIGIGGNTNFTTAMRLAEELLQGEFCDELVAVQMCAGRMNLDECFVPVTDDVVAAHVPSLLWGDRFRPGQTQPERFDFVNWIRDLGFKFTFDGSRAQSFDSTLDYLSTNYLCLGHSRKVVGYGLDEAMMEELDKLGVNVVPILAEELLKGDGGVRCLTRPLYM